MKAKIWCGHTRVSPDYDNYPILSVAGQDRMHGNDHRKKQYLSVLQILILCSEINVYFNYHNKCLLSI